MKYVLSILILSFMLQGCTKQNHAAEKASTQDSPTINASDRPTTATLDQMAPDFELPGHDGKTYKLSDLKGKIVVLEWFNHECPYVVKHYDQKAKNMQNTQSNMMKLVSAQGQELIWLSIISSAPGKQGHITAEEATALKSKLQGNMTAFLFDPEGTVGKAYEAKTTPHMYVIDQKGILKYMGGMDNKPSANVSSLAGAQNYVVEAVTSVLDNKPITNASTKPYGCSVKYL
ncbi:MAG: redoxin domain-containing protein [Bdellovibrionaceae bacterium]|nr:redoxin domain-containing protein [Pseudobdellovibrionaceae bacterium]